MIKIKLITTVDSKYIILPIAKAYGTSKRICVLTSNATLRHYMGGLYSHSINYVDVDIVGFEEFDDEINNGYDIVIYDNVNCQVNADKCIFAYNNFIPTLEFNQLDQFKLKDVVFLKFGSNKMRVKVENEMTLDAGMSEIVDMLNKVPAEKPISGDCFLNFHTANSKLFKVPKSIKGLVDSIK